MTPRPDLPPPDSPEAPKYWMYETSGKLAEAVKLYLEHPESLGPTAIGLLRAYFCQWINSPVWEMNPSYDPDQLAVLNDLRDRAAKITTVADVNAWIRRALNEGIDPL